MLWFLKDVFKTVSKIERDPKIMICIYRPKICTTEIDYTLAVIFKHWLGVEYSVCEHHGPEIKLTVGEKVISLSQSFFSRAERYWLEASSLPDGPLKQYPLAQIKRIQSGHIPKNKGGLPILFGEPVIKVEPDSVVCGIDIIGTIFFMLSRYEEAVITERDRHDRFPAAASIAYKAGFLDRPIVNEYLELLWAMIKHLWPGVQRKQRSFRMLLSHDVDAPFEDLFRPSYWVLRGFLADIVKRKDPRLAVERYRRWRSVKAGLIERDRYNNFDFIMRESERRSLRSAFYFLPSGSKDLLFTPTIYNPYIGDLMRQIADHGHEIGIHGHYDTYTDAEAMYNEAEKIRERLKQLAIVQDYMGGRQHYLRWKTPQTFQSLELAGLDYDTTLGYAEQPGFRCGTCYDFPVYDIEKRKVLKLMERPLIAMDVSVISQFYLNKGVGEDALRVFKNIKDSCRAYNGDFTLLWHNSSLAEVAQQELYLSVLDI